MIFMMLLKKVKCMQVFIICSSIISLGKTVLLLYRNCKQYLCTENFLQTGTISEWARTYEWLGSKRLVTFLVDNKPDEQNNSLEILSLKMHIELKPFMPLVVFCEVFQILHGELQLHLPANERKFDRPGYYYYPVAEPTSADIRVKKWLEKLK